MPRYHFHTADDGREHDIDGIELADDAAAKDQAVRFAGEVLAKSPTLLWDGNQFRVEVYAESGNPLFSVIVLTVEPARDLRSDG